MLKDKIKALINKNLIMKKEDGNNKRKIENLAVFLVILIVTIIVINLILGDNANSKQKEPQADSNKRLANIQTEEILAASLNNTQEDLASKLEEILGKIEGVGKVKAFITYSQTSQTIPLYNEDTTQKDTEEKDQGRW